MTDGAYDETEELKRAPLPTGELPEIERVGPIRNRRIRPIRITLKTFLLVAVAYFLLPGVVSGFRKAAEAIRDVNPLLIALGFLLQIVALFFYSLLTRAALGTVGESLSRMRLFRIQLSTKALSNIVPGGNAAGSALGYRLLTLSGISGPHAGFALATAGIGSAVVLNVIFWTGLIVSIPIRGVNPGYGAAALVGVIIIGIAAGLVFGIMEGQGRAERVVRWLARKLGVDEERFAAALRQIGERLEELAGNRQLLRRVVFWASANWLVDALSLWVFIRAFGETLDPDALIVAFGLANILAALPILPGGLGVVEGTYVTTLVGFGMPRSVAVTATAAYRSAQYLFPIFLGGLAYASLRVGPWSIEKRDRLGRLRELARTETERGESKLDFALRFDPHAQAPGRVVPDVAPPDESNAVPLGGDDADLDADGDVWVDGVPLGTDEAQAAVIDESAPATESGGDDAHEVSADGVLPPAGGDGDARCEHWLARLRRVDTFAAMTTHERPFGRYLEDFTPGDVLRHWPGKTITEYDDHLFCMITMNHHPLHTNDWFAAESVQGRNVVVGNLVYSLVLGMSVPDVSGAAIANLEVETLQHKFPTFHGDTIHAETRVLDVKESRSKPDRGVVSVETKGFNQDGKEVCYFRRKVLIWKRDHAPERRRPYDGTDVWAD